MKTTRVEARRILRRVYPDLDIVITRKDRIANLPVYEIEKQLLVSGAAK